MNRTGRVVSIVDSTLRDGLQTPGVSLDSSARMKIAEAIAMAGVQELEAGIPSASDSDAKEVARLAAMGLPCRITAWCRADAGDIDAAAAAKVSAVHISFPSSDILIEAFDKSRDWVLRRMEALIPSARARFPFVSVGLQDVPRADFHFIVKLARLAWEAGANRLRLADSCGVWNPFESFDVFRRISEEVPDLSLSIHSHNDLGMATANALGAVLGGASCVDSTVNGLGERSGNPPLAELVMAFAMSGIDCGVKSERMLPLAKLVSKLTKRPIAPDKPVVGASAFLHHSGLHVRALLKNPLSYQPFPPAKAGHREAFSVFIGPQSGRASVGYALSKLGLPVGSGDVEKALSGVKGEAPDSISGRIFEHE